MFKNWKFALLGSVLLSGATFAADGITVGGYASAGWMWVKNSANTFFVGDGAVYLGKKMGQTEVAIDLDFVSAGSTTSPAFGVGLAQSQAWVSQKYDNGFMWRLGQFDSLYGYEANDTADIMFANHGMLKGSTGLTHTGLHLGYDVSDMMGVHFLLANPLNTGAMASGAGNPDIGLKVATKFDQFTGSVGLLAQRTVNLSTGYLVDVIVGAEMDKLAVDLEGIFNKPSGGGTNGLGFGLQAGYGVTDTINAGARFEFTKTGATKTMEFTVGPQFWHNKDFSCRFDYTLNKVTGGGATTHTLALNSVYKF
jgi:hypothetical protein